MYPDNITFNSTKYPVNLIYYDLNPTFALFLDTVMISELRDRRINWEIKDNELFLATNPINNQWINSLDVGSLFANWFSGTLEIPGDIRIPLFFINPSFHTLITITQGKISEVKFEDIKTVHRRRRLASNPYFYDLGMKK